MKFRVWAKTSKTMYHAGFLLTQDGQLVYEAFPEDSVPAGICEVMFSTGVNDRDGKEIWEGDILAGVYRRQPMLVERHFLAADDDRNSAGQRLGLKVLGNKWEHGHLLEKSDG